MKITHITYAFNIGGTETMLVDVLNRQCIDNQVSLIIVNDSINNDLINKIDNKVRIIYIKRKPESRSIWSIIKLNYYLFKLKTDIIHLHSYSLPRIIINNKAKMWYTAHTLNIPMKYSKPLEGIIAISEVVKEDIQHRCNKKIVVIPNGIDVDSIKVRPSHQPSDSFRIVQVGRLDHIIKGQDILINAIAKLKENGIDSINVDFIGIGPSEKYLKELSKELNVENQIHFLGLKDREYIYSHLKNYDLMCHPARKEGFGLTIAEGLAAKLPVLVSMDGGPWEIIEFGKYGTGFITEDIDDCVSKIIQIKNHYTNMHMTVEKAYSYVKGSFSINRMVDEYLETYRTID